MRPLLHRAARFFTALAIAALTLQPFAVPVAHAAYFNPNLILSDQVMRNASSMSYADIQSFLDSQGGLGKQFDIDPNDGLLKNAAQLISDAAARYSINPKYILAVLQKESSAVTTVQPTRDQLDWAAGYALCDGCYKSSPSAQKYKGFGKQVDAAAGFIDWYMTNAPNLNYLKQPGITYAISGAQVTPANLATAALYSYTPHLHGNELLWNIWQKWWGSGGAAGTQSIPYPDGTLLRNTDNGAVALIQGGKFRPITNPSVLATRFAGIVPVDVGGFEFDSIQTADPGAPLKFADYSLVRTEDGTIYLLDGDTKRRITSMEVFGKIGFNPEEVEDVAAADLSGYVDGDPITLDSAYPTGVLLQDTSTGGVFYVRNGVKHAIWDKSILDADFSGQDIRPADKASLEAFPTGDPVKFKDGTLVKAPDDPSVYVIANGEKRRIPSEEVFLSYGYKWSSVVTTSTKVLSLYPDGAPLLLVDTGTVQATLAK